MADRNEMLKKRNVYKIPGMEQCRVVQNQVYKTIDETDLLLDVYYPADIRDGERRPAVVFVHGTVPDELIKNIKDSGQYTSWGQLVAASGFIAVIFRHRSTGGHVSLEDVGDDVDDLVRYVREHAEALQIDKERLAIWSCSAGVPLGARAALRGAPAFVKCFVVYYGPLDLQLLKKTDAKLTEDEARAFSATTYLESSAERLAPLFIVKAGLDHPSLNASIDTFLREASAKDVTIDFLTHPHGHHAFDVLDDVARSHEIIQRTLEFMKTALSR